MLTPQTIQDKKFERAVFGGYDMSQVDSFLDEILADYTALYKENATLKAKMKVVVDKLEEYRAVDEEVRKTLYTAKMSAKETVSAAQTEADNILRAARSEAQKHVGDLERETVDQSHRLESAKAATREYISKLKQAIAAMGVSLDRIMSEAAPAENIPEPESFEVELPPDLIEEEDPLPVTEEAKTQVFSPLNETEPEQDDLKELRFGKNYSEE